VERGEARRLGKPLVPADQGRDAPAARVEGRKAEIAGGEVEFFVVGRVFRNVHLAVESGRAAVGIDHEDAVVIDPRRPAFEKRGDDDDPVPPGEAGQGLGGRAGDRLR
jgi:hypothetical protein